jgi:hypothetical protein
MIKHVNFNNTQIIYYSLIYFYIKTNYQYNYNI